MDKVQGAEAHIVGHSIVSNTVDGEGDGNGGQSLLTIAIGPPEFGAMAFKGDLFFKVIEALLQGHILFYMDRNDTLGGIELQVEGQHCLAVFKGFSFHLAGYRPLAVFQNGAGEAVENCYGIISGDGHRLVKTQIQHTGCKVPLIVEAGFQIPGLGSVAGLRICKRRMLQNADQGVFFISLDKIVDDGLKGNVHTLVGAHQLAVDVDLGGIVNAAETELQSLLQLFLGDSKGGAVSPPAAADPLAVEGVSVEIRIIDKAFPLQIPVDTAGNGGIDPGD